MALHELCTNAVKYGALSNQSGRVDIDWAAAGNAPGFRLTWRESGGPKVGLPRRRGFGSRLIEQSLPADIGAEVSVEFKPEGLVCVIGADG
jgi:two-component sensor histidine kinase